MTPRWQPYSEPLRSTILRTFAIAMVGGAVLASFGGGMRRWPDNTLLMLWPSFGGHWIEIAFLNGLRSRISSARSVQIAARFAMWFLAGTIFAFCMRFTAIALALRWPAHLTWWIPGTIFIGVELLAHLPLELRGLPSFYNGRG
jgi:hypothetical protein